MSEIDERADQSAEDKIERRSFLKRISKYAIGLSAFGIASLFGLKRKGEIQLGKMKDTEFGLSEAQGTCGWGLGCSGGGGECGWGLGCGGGGGKCGWGLGCSGT